MPGVRFGPPPKKGPASQGMKLGGYISRQKKNKQYTFLKNKRDICQNKNINRYQKNKN